MKIAIVDTIGLCYDGNTLKTQGLGGSESAVILMSKELAKIGFEVTVFNNCIDSTHSSEGIYDSVRYIDNTNAENHKEQYDIVIVSRTTEPFINNTHPFIHTAKKRILWMHDTFAGGDKILEDLAVTGKIDHIFTLSDWHTSYILTCSHGKKRNHEVLKKKIFQTRNGAVCHIPEVDLSKKDPNHFVYNASATKGMIPLVEHIWPEIKKKLPQAKLSIIGGYYRFREGSEPDAQENTVAKLAQRQDLKDLDVTFTGVIPQYEIAEILSKSWMMLYPGAFPETFGISSLESLLYKTPLMTTRFGALEETAVDLACYHIDYAIEPNSLFPHINKEQQVQKFLQAFFTAYSTPYLHQQKQNYCDVVKDVAGWDTVALQWKQFFYSIMGDFLPVNEYREVTRINNKVARVFGRTSIMPAPKEYRSYGDQRRIVVISPFWNAENYIEKHIRSVAAQDYDNYLHILVNDASTDNSRLIAEETIKSVDTDNIVLINNEQNNGCIRNQLSSIDEFVESDDIVMLLDGDDWLVNNNTIFHYYNDLYKQDYEFTYGSMWSVVDNIPLIAQEYPSFVKKNRLYRNHHFNWKIPYTHLRTCLGKYFQDLNRNKFKVDGEWMKSGADNPLFYELIERVEPDRIYCNREVVCNYNDANPLNDYKIRGDEQNRNAGISYKEVKSFEDAVNGKTVAVVGNAKYLNDYDFGDEIDSADVVIRFNRALVYPIEKKSHGTKTTFWAVWREKEYLDKNLKSLYKFDKVIQAGPDWHEADIISKDTEMVPKDIYQNLKKETIKDPSSGLIILEWLSKLNPKSVSVYGFDWKKTGSNHNDKLPYYTNDQHNFNREREISERYNFNMVNGNKRILVGIPTNKYIEVETFKSLWDLEVPEGYELDFQYFYGYSRSQVLNLACEWGRRYDASLFIERNVTLAKNTVIKCLEVNKDVVSLNIFTSLFIKNDVIDGLEYPHFEASGSDLQEKHVFAHKAVTKGFSYVNLDGLVRKIEKISLLE